MCDDEGVGWNEGYEPTDPRKPEEKTSEYHRHKCKFCGFVWEHHNSNDVKHGDKGAHECPGCDRCNWSLGIYDGDEKPQIRTEHTEVK